VIANTGDRVRTSLNGRWRVIVDPYETGYYNYRGEPWTHGYFRNFKPRGPADLVEYDFDASDQLDVPGDWNSQSERLFFYEGTVWYKTDFDWTPRPGTRLFLHFGAANYEAKVWLNGEAVGEHAGGFTPFQYEIGAAVKEGGNFVVVKVDNRRRREAVPTVNTDWWNYGGLTREVALVEVPETFVRDYFVQLERGSRDRIRGWVQLDGGDAAQSVVLRIPEVGADALVLTDATGYAEIELEADLELWSPGNPKLYEVEIEAESDRVVDRIGFRSVETRGHDILLNGEPLFLRGISVHEEAPLRAGRAHSDEDARTLLGWALELGANFVRLAHYPHNEAMVRAADEMGLLLWCEIPVYWTITWENQATLACAKSQLGEMIERDKNRAAVILWSVANETPRSEARLEFLVELAEFARDLDPTRLVTAALERRFLEDRTLSLDDPLGGHLDVIGCNEYLGWYYVAPDAIHEFKWRTAWEKPVIVSELGGGALQGYRGDRGTRWTEDYQADLYRHQIRMLRDVPFLRGISPWILKDFRSPKRVLPGVQDYWNRKGLVSDRGQRKQAFFVLQEFYRELARRESGLARDEG
jgi:beta-glucuronidase